MSKAVWTEFAENLEQQVRNNERVIEGYWARGAPRRPDKDPAHALIESLKDTNAELRKLAARARSKITE